MGQTIANFKRRPKAKAVIEESGRVLLETLLV